jgi:beta-xylosidase
MIEPQTKLQKDKTTILYSQEKQYQLYHEKPGQYIITTKTGEWNRDLLYQIYHMLKISINPRSTTLDTLSEMLNKKS